VQVCHPNITIEDWNRSQQERGPHFEAKLGRYECCGLNEVRGDARRPEGEDEQDQTKNFALLLLLVLKQAQLAIWSGNCMGHILSHTIETVRWA
jgi:hypothetical protein